jgi:AcrR family transcriptional regulator
MDLFVRQGFDRTTVRQIVAAGGISMRTFFRYFQSKLDLAFPRTEEGTRRLAALLEAHHDPDDPLGGVRDALVEFGSWYGSIAGDLIREWQYESHSPALVARAAEIERGNQLLVASELERCGVAPALARYLASVIFGGITADLAAWFADECRGDLLESAGNTIRLIDGLDRLFLRGAASLH